MCYVACRPIRLLSGHCCPHLRWGSVRSHAMPLRSLLKLLSLIRWCPDFHCVFAGTNVTVSGVYCELSQPLIDAEGSACAHNCAVMLFVHFCPQVCKCVPPGHDSQSRLYVQMMTAMTGHCTHLAHVPSSAQVIVARASWYSLWALMAVLCCTGCSSTGCKPWKHWAHTQCIPLCMRCLQRKD